MERSEQIGDISRSDPNHGPKQKSPFSKIHASESPL